MERSPLEHVVFIIGAGHSVAACAPNTSELTEWIVRGDERIRGAGARWSEDVGDLLRAVKDRLEDRIGVAVTYESLYTWLWTSYFSDDPSMYRVAWADDPFAELGLAPRGDASKATAYGALRRIEDGVYRALRDERLFPERLPRLTLDAVGDRDVATVTLITLNHDRLLELRLGQLDEPEPPYDDGFPGSLAECASWDVRDPGSGRDWTTPVQLVKLHGSIDWWSPGGWNDAGLVYRSRVRPTEKCNKVPLFLVGTGPKLFQSSNLMFARQVLDAGRALARATSVITVGYGFGDVRMNSLWSGATNLENRGTSGFRIPTLMIDPQPKAVISRLSSLQRANGVGNWFRRGAETYISSEAAKCSWKDCKQRVIELQKYCASGIG